MSNRVPLYERLPEIYRLRDDEQSPPGQLRAYLAAVEMAFSAIQENIESLYHDLFIDTCDDWVIPYVADLVGASHLKGEPRTLRADVADTIALRRRKGTLAAIERLAANLTGWAARSVELRENLGWNQHLNHLRPDVGGASPYAAAEVDRFVVRRGGTLPVRDPARLSLLGTPFDAAAYTCDVKPAHDSAVHYNLPNLAIFLWRLDAYRLRVVRPLVQGFDTITAPAPEEAPFVVRFDLHPLDRGCRLFNTFRTLPGDDAPSLTQPDQVPGPIPAARLTSASEAGNPRSYVGVDTFDPAAGETGLDLSDAGLQLFLPHDPFAGTTWTFRGDNLCAWAAGLRRRVGVHEIVIDPTIGRIAIGVGNDLERDALTPVVDAYAGRVRVGYTYGAPAPVGAHPVSRGSAPAQFQGQAVVRRIVNTLGNPGFRLQDALENLRDAASPTVIEIHDSLVHELDPAAVTGTTTMVDGAGALAFNRSVVIRAASGQRPIVRLTEPLRFRPTDPGDPGVERLTVRFEGIYLTRGELYPDDAPLVARAAVAALEFLGCTLDPGGFRARDGTRTPMSPPSLRLTVPYGFTGTPGGEEAFSPTPTILLQRSISGALHLDSGYTLRVEHSIVDAGRGVSDATDATFAIRDGSGAPNGWGAPLTARQAVFLGRVRVAHAAGEGGIWVHRLEVHENQTGCIKYSYFRGDQDRLPQNHACVLGGQAPLRFVSEWFEDASYAQLALSSDSRILNRGPDDDQMGAYGAITQESHKWTNLQIRLREFMPLGVRPLVVPVT